ncbi:MAG: alpha/beta hydrolase [Hyphomonadaceae bacterium]|nr:MAG: esterase/lipase [Caulobacteraceae bacterium]MBT9447663.1 alpha/beta hydrolase [Hyphomonadaceae bacterium]TPW05217.1 MAG: esterase/lipase [Alphaproteobacteria bacterium]
MTEVTPGPQWDEVLDRDMLPIVRRMRERMASRAPMTSVEPEAMRARAAADFAVWNEDPPELPQVTDLILDTPPPLQARLYCPEPTNDCRGLLVHFHGGGWVIGDIDFEDRACRSVARESGMKVLSVAYRLAPETKFPEPVHDCVAATRWARDNAAQLDIDPARIALGGASAGANLAIAAALHMRALDVAGPAFLLLLYGVYDMRTDTESYRLFGDGGYGLGGAALDFFMTLYLRSPEDRDDPLASPLRADLRGLAPCFLAIAGIDPLRDDSRMLGAKLREARVEVEVREYEGVLHGFTQFARESALGRRALSDAAMALKAALAG